MRRDDLVASASYRPVPTAAAEARRFVHDTLRGWAGTGNTGGDHRLIDDAMLITSELVTNAVLHARTRLEVTCRLGDEAVEVIVSDAHPAGLIPEPPDKGRVPAERTGGRGLLLPAALASCWGVTYGRTSKSVWFRLPFAGPGAGTGRGPDGAAGAETAGLVDGEPGGLVDGEPGDLPGSGRADRGAGPRRVVAGSELATSACPQPAGFRRHASPDVPMASQVDLAAASRQSGVGWYQAALAGAATAAGWPGARSPDDDVLTYGELLATAVESARAVMNADGAYALMPDEDGDLSVRASAGTMRLPSCPEVTGVMAEAGTMSEADRTGAPQGTGKAVSPGAGGSPATVRPPVTEPSVITVPFLVGGRVTGLLAVASSASRRFGDDEHARLHRLADRWAHTLERARTRELGQVRRGWIEALTQARGLLSGDLTRTEAMDLAGWCAVPKLARWCAVLVPADARLRTVYARHADESLAGALTWLLDQVSDLAGPAVPSPRRPPAHGPAWRWTLAIPSMERAPTGAADLVSDVAWCYPLGPDIETGVFAVGLPCGGRLPREAAQLVADLACRLGVALAGGTLARRRR